MNSSMQSMDRFLNDYQKNKYDDELLDPITLESQDDYFESGRAAWPCLPDLISIMRTIPLMMRTILISSPCPQGISMNPWLVVVLDLPSVIKRVNTNNFFLLESKNMNGETFNSGFLLSSNPEHNIIRSGIGKHISSFLISGKSNMFHPEADLAIWASVVLYVLKHPTILSWMFEELDTIQNLCKLTYNDPVCSWNQYVKNVKSENFRLCLVAQHPSLNPAFRCPHLNKFIFACFILRDSLSSDELRRRRDALISEYYGRFVRSEIMTAFLSNRTLDIMVSKILSEVDFELCPSIRETIKRFTVKVSKYDYKQLDVESIIWSTLPGGYSKCYITSNFLNIFKKLNKDIPDLDDTEWHECFLHGVVNSDAYIRNTVKQPLNLTFLKNEIRLQVITKLINSIPVFVLKKFWMLKNKKGLMNLYDQHALDLFQTHWSPVINYIFMECADHI